VVGVAASVAANTELLKPSNAIIVIF
jgi:hypothetical protein